MSDIVVVSEVVGSVRTQGEKKHVMAFKISAVSCKAEWDAHILQVRPINNLL